MRGLLKTELKKAFQSPWFMSAVLIGLACTVWCLLDAAKWVYGEGGWYEYRKQCMEMGTIPAAPETATLYTCWLGMSQSTAHTVFYRIFPLLSLLPCGISISEELNGGYVKRPSYRWWAGGNISPPSSRRHSSPAEPRCVFHFW